MHSLYVTFGGRDGLLAAIYESFTPLFDIEAILARPGDDIEETVYAIYRALATGLARRPGVAPALLADALSRPDGAAMRLIERYLPRAVDGIGRWLTREMAQGRVRSMPVPLLLGQLLGPFLFSALSWPPMSSGPVPDLDEACRSFADMFVSAVVRSGDQSEVTAAATRAAGSRVTRGEC